MKRITSLIIALIGLCGAGLAQSYNTAAGIRLGTDWGLTVRQRVYENISAEMLIISSLQRDEGMLTLMGLVHQPLIIRNLNLYIGGGLHTGWTTEEKDGVPVKNPFGLDLIGGAELTIARVNISWDFKPAINLVGGSTTFYSQTGISVRYALWKREKYDWERNNNRRRRNSRNSIFNRRR